MQLLFICLFLSLSISNVCAECIFNKHKSVPVKEKERLKPLDGKTFSVVDGKYVYTIGICTMAPDTPTTEIKQTQVGVYQYDTTTKSGHAIGRISDTEIMMGTEWIMLEYEQGDKYSKEHGHCHGEARRASIMIVCKPGSLGEARLIEENNNKTSDCYYMFEIDHEAACSKLEPKVYGLSVGSVIVIIVVVLAGLYLLGGMLYLRFVGHAKGMDQIPHWSFWQDFGNLQADGCGYICRCGKLPSYSEPRQRTYKGVGDDQLEDEDEANDDHLLPM